MSDYAERMALIKRERETEHKVRAMDAHEIVDMVHGLEDAIEGLIEDKQDLDDALENLIHLHMREQIRSGEPSQEEWDSAVNSAAEALTKARGQ